MVGHKNVGECGFSVATTRMWNVLAAYLKDIQSVLHRFCWQLKAHFLILCLGTFIYRVIFVKCPSDRRFLHH